MNYNAPQIDCDDNDPTVHPGLHETGAYCSDGKDNDCDGLIDSMDPDCPSGLSKPDLQSFYDRISYTRVDNYGIRGTYYCGIDNLWHPLSQLPRTEIMASKIYSMINQSDKGLLLCGGLDMINYNLSKMDESVVNAIRNICIGAEFSDSYNTKRVVIGVYLNRSVKISQLIKSFYPFIDKDLSSIDTALDSASNTVDSSSFFYAYSNQYTVQSTLINVSILYNKPLNIAIIELNTLDNYRGLIGFFKRLVHELLQIFGFINTQSSGYSGITLNGDLNYTHMLYSWNNDLYIKGVKHKGIILYTNIDLDQQTINFLNGTRTTNCPQTIIINDESKWQYLPRLRVKGSHCSTSRRTHN